MPKVFTKPLIYQNNFVPLFDKHSEQMYIIIKKDTQKAIIIAETTSAAGYLNCHRHTLKSNIKKTNPWIRETETVYYTTEYYGSNKIGNKDKISVKIAKKNGEIPRNKDKKKGDEQEY